jgi:hypothetical protein
MDAEDIRELNREAVEAGSVLLSIPEQASGEVESAVSSVVPDLTSLFRQSPMLFSAAAFAVIVTIAYSIGATLRPNLVLMESDGEMVLNRNRLALLAIALAVLTVGSLNYFMA